MTNHAAVAVRAPSMVPAILKKALKLVAPIVVDTTTLSKHQGHQGSSGSREPLQPVTHM